LTYLTDIVFNSVSTVATTSMTVDVETVAVPPIFTESDVKKAEQKKQAQHTRLKNILGPKQAKWR
jgi:hypothetical protein